MKKKHLSKIILNNIALTILGSFLGLMIVTAVCVNMIGKSKADSLIMFSLDDLKDYLAFIMDLDARETDRAFADDLEDVLEDDLSKFLIDPELNEDLKYYLRRVININSNIDEINIMDENGIIVISTMDEYEGYDMHVGKQSSEFLCLLEGEDTYVQDLREISYDNMTQMLYSGASFNKIKGFVEIGMTMDTYLIECKTQLSKKIRDERIGRTGFYLLVDSENKVIGSFKNKYNGKELALSSSCADLAAERDVISNKVFGTESYIGVMKFNDDYIVAVYPVAEAWETWNLSMFVHIFMYLIVFAILFIIINRLLAKHVVRGVYSLNDSLGRITQGNLEEKANFRDSMEFDSLSDGINYTVDRLKNLIKEAEERIDDELALAAKIQTSAIPHKFPPFPDRNEFDLFASMVPAREVGGDFYDFFLIDDDHLALVMADVSGKGIPAAMFMVMARDRIRYHTLIYATDVASAIKEVNLGLLRENEAGLFVTVWLGVVTISTGHIDYVNAGHEYPAIYRSGKSFKVEDDVHSGPVAALKRMEYDAGTFDLAAGDILYLYTDGVTEANNPAGEMFRSGRMLEALNTDPSAAVEVIDANVRTAIADFAEDAPQFDDTTTLIFKYNG